MSETYIKLLVENNEAVEATLVEEFEPGDQVGLFVHESVVENFKQSGGFTYDERDWDYELKIGSECFNMKIIYLTIESNEHLQLLLKYIKTSQFAFPWADKPTIFCDDNSCSTCDEFIERHDLNRSIVNVEFLKCGVTLDSDLIKTITFNNPKFDVIDAYSQFLSNRVSTHKKYFYISFAFTWLQPKSMKHYEIPIDIVVTNQILPIILDQLTTVAYSNGLTVFDLLNLKLALCNPLDPPNCIQNEIDYLLERSFTQMSLKQTYIRDRHFDLHQYAFDYNFAPGDVFDLIPYLTYEWQTYIETTEKLDNILTEHMFVTYKLCDRNDILGQIRNKSNIKVIIDGSGYEFMDIALLFDLLACHNVVKIILDTSYAFATFKLNKPNIELNRIVEIKLIGSNAFSSGDSLLTLLKSTLKPSQADRYLDVTITGNQITSYFVFDSFRARQVIFRDIQINGEMLDTLKKCTLLINYIRFAKCTLDNKIENWMVLNELPQLQHVIIQEDEDTWESLFEFIAHNLSTSGEDHFQFNRFITILSDCKQINLHRIKFTIDRLNSKLEFNDVYNDCQLIDLYDLKNRFWHNEKSDFEFYQ